MSRRVYRDFEIIAPKSAHRNAWLVTIDGKYLDERPSEAAAKELVKFAQTPLFKAHSLACSALDEGARKCDCGGAKGIEDT